MTHIFPKGENSFHKEKIDCECNPVIKWDEDICIHLPLTINLYGISDNNDPDISLDDDDTDDEQHLL